MRENYWVVVQEAIKRILLQEPEELFDFELGNWTSMIKTAAALTFPVLFVGQESSIFSIVS